MSHRSVLGFLICLCLMMGSFSCDMQEGEGTYDRGDAMDSVSELEQVPGDEFFEVTADESISPLGDLAAVAPGIEFRVNTYTMNDQFLPAVAMSIVGRIVIAWQSSNQDGNGLGIYAQLYDTSGQAQGDEFRVNSYTSSDQWHPSVAIATDGRFIIAWQSNGQDGSGYGIYAQRFDASGVVQGNEFRVNANTASDQAWASVAMASDGRFVVAWQSSNQDGDNLGVYAQRYDASGLAVGSEFRVNTYTIGTQAAPSVTMAPDGRFVVVWESYGQDGSGYGVYAQRYDASGAAQGNEFLVNTYTTGSQAEPALAISSDGRFVVAWQSDSQDGNSSGVYAQRFDASGVVQGDELPVNTYTLNAQAGPSVAMDSDGRFVVVWISYGQDGDNYGVFAQRFDALGMAVGNEFLVNTYTTGSQSHPAVAIISGGEFVVTWQSSGQDGSGGGIYAKLCECISDSDCGVGQCVDGVCNTPTTTSTTITSTSTTTTHPTTTTTHTVSTTTTTIPSTTTSTGQGTTTSTITGTTTTTNVPTTTSTTSTTSGTDDDTADDDLDDTGDDDAFDDDVEDDDAADDTTPAEDDDVSREDDDSGGKGGCCG